MKDSMITQAVDEVICRNMRAIGKIIEELVIPLSDVGAPQDVIGKPFAEWQPEDLQRAMMIYGQQSDSPLAKGLASYHIERVRKLRSEV
jgi:hypothetical protein